MKTFVAHRFASTRCQSAKWIIVHDDDAVIRWKLLVDKLKGNTVQYNFNCLYSPPVNEFPMRHGQNNVSRKFESLTVGWGHLYPSGYKGLQVNLIFIRCPHPSSP